MTHFLIRKIILTVCFTVSIPFFINGQQTTILFDPSIPTSPQAEAFKRYGEYSVNNQTGVPDISIPLYELNLRGYKLPLSLKYYPQTLKPGYNYDVFGHGWALSINSSISRTINSVPDEKRDFKIDDSQLNIEYNFNGDPENTLPWLLENYNYAHDIFHAILPDGSSFDFFIDKVSNGLVYTILEERNVKISCTYTSNVNIASFTITDEDGVIYTFAESDNLVFSFYKPMSLFQHYGTNVAWHLTNITLPNSKGFIGFQYGMSIKTEYSYEEKEVGFGRYSSPYSDSDPKIFQIISQQYSLYKMKLLTVIFCEGVNINFNFKYPQQDKAKNYVTQINIAGSYSTCIDLNMTETTASFRTYNDPLVKLNSISINSVPAETPQTYTFGYESQFPYFGGLDHWGNLNNSNAGMANFNFYTEFDPNEYNLSSPAVYLGQNNAYHKFKLMPNINNSDDRQPSTPEQYGILKKITYPTGGYTEFVFENHQFLTTTALNGDYINNPNKRRKIDAAGFRIKKITNYTANQQIADVKNYRYGGRYVEGLNIFNGSAYDSLNFPNAHTGLGIAVVDPNILTYMKYDSHGVIPDIFGGNVNSPFGSVFFSVRNMVKGVNIPNQNPLRYIIDNRNTWAYEYRFSPIHFRALLNGRPSVIYSDVTVYHGDIGESEYQYFPENTAGKTVYQYDVIDYLHDPETGTMKSMFFEETLYKNRYNLSYDDQSYQYNKLTNKTDYRYDFDLQEYKPVNKENSNWYFYKNRSSYYDWSNSRPFFMNYYPGKYQKLLSFFTQDYKFIGYSQLLNRDITTYSATGTNITTSESYSYNLRNQLTHKSTVNSDGKCITTTYQYPEILSTGTPPAISDMVSKNIISPVIKQETNSNGKFVTGTRIEYNVFNNSIIMPSESYQLEVNPSSSVYVLRKQATKYTAKGNPKEIENDGVYTAYLWDSDDRYLFSKIINARHNDVAYTSFEDNCSGSNWTVPSTTRTTNSRTGNKCYNLSSGSVTKSGFVANTAYTLSYWSKQKATVTITNSSTPTLTTGVTINGWTYFVYTFTPASSSAVLTISGAGILIDELRLYPSDARMTTYTYRSFEDISSETDPSGRTIFYEYDNFGRLIRITNDNGKILKEHKYNYAQ